MIKKILYLLLLIVILVPFLMVVHWKLKPEKELNVLILDKSVLLSSSIQEHISFSWILNNEKYVHSVNGTYDAFTDYFGFFPDGKGNYSISDFNHYSEEQLDSLVKSVDLFYYTDLYGVYSNDWDATYFPDSSQNERYISERSNRLYGGMTMTELQVLKKAKHANKLIINEFNIIASPTPSDVRFAYEKEFDIKWTGWVGRYFDNLDTLVNMDLPRWLIRNYVQQHNNQWPFKEAGIAFVNEKDRVEILENKVDLNVEVPYIYTATKYVKHYNVDDKMKYPFWFEIIEVGKDIEVISEYKLDVTLKGNTKLKFNNIPSSFPALVCSNNRNYYYLCGDFCDNPISMRSSYFSYIDYFSFMVASKEKLERNTFFWNYYRPFVKTVLNDYYITINNR